MSTPDRPAVLAMPPRGRMVDERLRLVSALVVAPASVVLIVGHWYVFGAIGLFVSAMWVRGFVRASRLAADTRELRLDADSVTLVDGPTTNRILWTDVASIELEDDASTLVLRLRDGATARIESGYGDLGTEALHDLLGRHRLGAFTATHG